MHLMEAIKRDGFAMVPAAVELGVVEELVRSLESNENFAGMRQQHLTIEAVKELARSEAIRKLVEPIVGSEARVVRSILFDKNADRNWGVPWHQDLTICVRERKETAGFVGWSVKDGVTHVQAPREVLEGMLTVRVHLDDCGMENGPLRVLAGSHRFGWLEAAEIERLKREGAEVACVVGRGGVVLMRPLILHASSKARAPGHRRVVHL